MCWTNCATQYYKRRLVGFEPETCWSRKREGSRRVGGKHLQVMSSLPIEAHANSNWAKCPQAIPRKRSCTMLIRVLAYDARVRSWSALPITTQRRITCVKVSPLEWRRNVRQLTMCYLSSLVRFYDRRISREHVYLNSDDLALARVQCSDRKCVEPLGMQPQQTMYLRGAREHITDRSRSNLIPAIEGIIDCWHTSCVERWHP